MTDFKTTQEIWEYLIGGGMVRTYDNTRAYRLLCGELVSNESGPDTQYFDHPDLWSKVVAPKTAGDLEWALAEIQAGRWVRRNSHDLYTYGIEAGVFVQYHNVTLCLVNNVLGDGSYISAPDPRKGKQ